MTEDTVLEVHWTTGETVRLPSGPSARRCLCAPRSRCSGRSPVGRCARKCGPRSSPVEPVENNDKGKGQRANKDNGKNNVRVEGAIELAIQSMYGLRVKFVDFISIAV